MLYSPWDPIAKFGWVSTGCPGRLEHRHAVEDRRQRIAQLMGQRRQELVLSPIGLQQRRFRSLTIRDITCDFRRADHLAAFVFDWRDRQRNREPATVLTSSHGL